MTFRRSPIATRSSGHAIFQPTDDGGRQPKREPGTYRSVPSQDDSSGNSSTSNRTTSVPVSPRRATSKSPYIPGSFKHFFEPKGEASHGWDSNGVSDSKPQTLEGKNRGSRPSRSPTLAHSVQTQLQNVEETGGRRSCSSRDQWVEPISVAAEESRQPTSS